MSGEMPVEVVDTHVHYWEPDRADRPWAGGGVNLGPPFSVEQLIAHARDAGVTRVVQVTPSIMGYDNRYAIEGALRYPDRIVGVIGRFDPVGNDLPDRLARYLAQPKMLGARLTVIKEWTAWLEPGVLDPFLHEAGAHGMPVQIYAPRQAIWLRELALRHPGTPLLVDHMTLSHDDPEPFAHWPDVLRLAEAPNVWMKVSYFPEVAHEGFPFARTWPYFEQLFERFGPDRLIWGSNYPPSLNAATYRESAEFVNAMPFLGESDKRKIYGENFLHLLRSMRPALAT
jgi:predicted TIM-barrel fold metal-dependent hydrolase